MRRITKDLRSVQRSVDAYEKGRAAFVNGESFSDLGQSEWALERAGFIDALSDLVTDLAQQQGFDLSRLLAPPRAQAEKPQGSSHKPVNHGARANAAPFTPSPVAVEIVGRVTGEQRPMMEHAPDRQTSPVPLVPRQPAEETVQPAKEMDRTATAAMERHTAIAAARNILLRHAAINLDGLESEETILARAFLEQGGYKLPVTGEGGELG